MRHETACGVLLFQDRPRKSFLILLHEDDRIDLPKGRLERGEDELECALREMEEETGIDRERVRVVDGFRFVTTWVMTKRSGARVTKSVVLFAVEAEGPCAVRTPDHDDYAWVTWQPPHAFPEHRTLDLALSAWEAFAAATRPRAPRRKAS